MRILILLLVILTFPIAALAQSTSIESPTVFEMHEKIGYVVVTPNGPLDGGDFGRFTPGTTTSGIQEAIDYALASVPQQNVWITGKQDMQSRAGTYTTFDTIYVPPTQGFRIESGNYLLWHTGTTGGAIWIDSSMNGYYQFGIVGSSTKSGGVVNIRPENLLPVDTWCYPANVTVTYFRAECIIGSGDPNVYGLAIDSTGGSLGGNTFVLNEIAGTGIGLYLFGNRDITSNEINVVRNHGNTIDAQIGSDTMNPELISANDIQLQMDSDGIKGAKGLVIASCQDNLIKLLACNGYDKGLGLIFGPKARQNIVTITTLPSGFTNNAEKPTNRIIATSPVGFGIETPEVPKSGMYTINRNPYEAEIIISEPGDVTEWSITDANDIERKFKSKLSAGQTIRLSPGEKFGLDYATPPEWQWRAMP